MNQRLQMWRSSKVRITLCALACTLAALVQLAQAQEQKPPLVTLGDIAKGQRIVTTTHSFNVYVFNAPRGGGAGAMGPLARLATEVGVAGQEQVALQMIGNSTVTQHWDRGGEDNAIKQALRAGNFDVFTLAPHRIMPEPAINQFADLAIKGNPNCRIMAQISWSSWDGNPNGQNFTNPDHNKLTKEDLTVRFANSVEDYAVRLRKQLAGINERNGGRSTGFVVPVSQGVLQLRLATIEGRLPGVTEQSQLFSDAMGHPGQNQVLANLVEYIWFAAMYHRSPIGLKTFVKEGDENSAKTQKLLQEIALDVITKEPMSGYPKAAAAAPMNAGAKAGS